MNLHRDAFSSKQNFLKIINSQCKCIFCSEKKVFLSNNTAVLKFQIKRMVSEAIFFIKEVIIRKSCLKIQERAKGLVLFFKTMKQTFLQIKEQERPVNPCEITKVALGSRQLTY